MTLLMTSFVLVALGLILWWGLLCVIHDMREARKRRLGEEQRERFPDIRVR